MDEFVARFLRFIASYEVGVPILLVGIVVFVRLVVNYLKINRARSHAPEWRDHRGTLWIWRIKMSAYGIAALAMLLIWGFVVLHAPVRYFTLVGYSAIAVAAVVGGLAAGVLDGRTNPDSTSEGAG